MAVRLNVTLPKPCHKAKPSRDDLPHGANLCAHCSAKCCRYFALPIDTPETWTEFEYIRWFLLHERATVFTEEGTWYLMVHSRCKHLRRDRLCDIYARRPAICRQYKTSNCEYDDTWIYERYLETPEQVEEYAEAVLGPRDRRGIRSPRPEPERPRRRRAK
jgi:uncharacterized protein